MTMEPPPQKRRRLDASAALSKPFKSPFRSVAAPSLTSPTPNAESAVSSPHAIPGLTQDQTTQPENDESAASLMHQKQFLETQLASLRIILEGAKQALRIQKSGKDPELEALIIKWRFISQAAANEVFVGAKERVDRMGGVTAWKQRSMYDTQWGFEDTDMADDKTPHETDRVEKEEDKEFTMGFMLDTLNIEHGLIGYDPQTGTWED